CGDGVPESKKGLFNSHLADVSQFLKGYHLQINARSEFDVTPAQIMKRVNEGSGSKYSVHKETYEPERIRPLQSAYKKTEIPDISALQRNPTKPESAPREKKKRYLAFPLMWDLMYNYNIGSKPFGSSSLPSSTPPSKPAEPLWKSSASTSQSPPTSSSSSSSASKPVERSWKSSVGSSYVASTGTSFNKVAPPSSLTNYGVNASSAPEPTVNKAHQMRLEREAREKEERARIEKEIRDREAREARESSQESSGQVSVKKQLEERRAQEALEREREQEQQQQHRSQDRVREERAAREREERERAEAEDAARSAREAAKAREEANARQQADQEAEEKQRQREREEKDRQAAEEKEKAEKIAKQKKAEEEEEAKHRRKQQEEEEVEQRRKQAEEERHEQERADAKRRQEEEEEENRLQAELNAAAAKTVALGADALIASSEHPEVTGNSVSAVVLYSYESAEENEMSLYEGEIIVNVTELDVGWWSGESEDGTRSGLFPANYVEIIEHAHHATPAATSDAATTKAAGSHGYEEDAHAHAHAPAKDDHHASAGSVNHVEEVLSSKPTAIALYDYNAGEPNEISFSEGDIIVDIDFVTEDWWNGHSQDGTRSGLFPSNYVELHQ
ncbi:hypothetical protein BGZ94_001833, partial [Podila epigama]